MFGLFKKRVDEDHSPSKSQFQKRDFSAAQNKLFFDGWTTQASSIDRVLKGQHTSLVARSREQVRNNPLMRHAANIMAKNVIGSKGRIWPDSGPYIMIAPRRRTKEDAASISFESTLLVNWAFLYDSSLFLTAC